ncbi:MAG: exodeoxyribonuclease VII small subunit [Coprobacillus sp.]|nr:exodeoxyribonuclease VII small subunit [Coprobacillus sp.]
MPEKKSELKSQLDELDELVAKMGDSDLGLDETLVLYNRATELINSIEKLLNETEEKIKEIVGKE